MTSERDHRIDFFRGLALIFIFWDHVPHNPLGQITPRNFGFSDAAEIFVFLAGYAAVLAYGKILKRDGYLFACLKILRRAWVLYVVHIFLLAMLMGIVFFANSHVETRDLVEEMGMHHFITDPQQALTDIALCSGFYDQAHFIHQFQRITGQTPGQYRRRKQSQFRMPQKYNSA